MLECGDDSKKSHHALAEAAHRSRGPDAEPLKGGGHVVDRRIGRRDCVSTRSPTLETSDIQATVLRPYCGEYVVLRIGDGEQGREMLPARAAALRFRPWWRILLHAGTAGAAMDRKPGRMTEADDVRSR